MNRKTRILARSLLLALVAYAFTGCTTGTAPTPEQVTAYSNALHQGIYDYKLIREIQRTP